MATMNLRTRSFGSKNLKPIKPSETLPEINFPVSEEIKNILDKIKSESSFDHQTQKLRQFVLKLDGNGHENEGMLLCPAAFMLWF